MSDTRSHILVVDDKPNMIALLKRVLGDACVVHSAGNGREALQMLDRVDVDVIVSDIVMPEVDGMQLLLQARRKCPETQIILMTGHGTVEQAVQAVKAGAFDYVTKPFDPDDMVETIHKAARLRHGLKLTGEWPGVIGISPAMAAVFRAMQSVKNADLTVLLTGESGTGKGLVARALHTGGKRATARFVSVNCGAIPRDLIEAELMGFAAGAFTGAVAAKQGLVEDAEGGTLFLDEISELPAELQVKMNTLVNDREIRRVGEIRVRKIDVRFIAATNRDLARLTAERRFREDLYYRLNVFPIELPPLRQRREDIPLLAKHCLATSAAREGKMIDGFAPDVEAALAAYHWPGNVRELENLVERAVILATGTTLTVDCFPRCLFDAETPAAFIPEDLTRVTYRQVMEVASDAATRVYLERLLALYNGNVTRAAVHAGMERQSLHRLLRRHGVKSGSYKG
jgi:DNA-binding NtrC family response regulator